MSAVVTQATERGAMSIGAFRAFQMGRSDKEVWELVDGTPVMMTPTLLCHARIARNVENLLLDALEKFDPARTALQNIGVDLGLAAETLEGLGRADRYAPQPDVGVVDAVFGPDQRFARRLYAAVEIVSDTDDEWIAPIGMRWIDAKARIYQAHRQCEAVVVIEQNRIEARLAMRSGSNWTTTVLREAADVLSLPTCGLTCKVGDLYRGTPLASTWIDR